MEAVKSWTAMESCGNGWSWLAWTHFVYHGCKWTGKTALAAKGSIWLQHVPEGMPRTAMDCHGPKIKWIAMDHHGSGWMRMEDS